MIFGTRKELVFGNNLSNLMIRIPICDLYYFTARLCILFTLIYFSGGIDLAFLVDTSSNLVGPKNFKLVMALVSRVFHSFTLGNGMRYGLVVFGDRVEVLQVVC